MIDLLDAVIAVPTMVLTEITKTEFVNVMKNVMALAVKYAGADKMYWIS